MYAALNMTDASKTPMLDFDMDITVNVNTHGKIVLLHNQPFDQIPLWIRYKNASRRLEILFEDGSFFPLSETMNDSAHTYLVRSGKVTLIRTENNKPVEGWETILLNDTYQ